jgi:hypothetical protein
MAAVGIVLATVAAAVVSAFLPATSAAAVDDADWLGVVNAYRSMSGLSPVSAEPAWAAGTEAHSCYMVINGLITHTESPSLPGYSDEGNLAGSNGNVAVSGSVEADARSHIDLWMTGPFHTIGILRHNLTRTAYGECEDAAAARWRSGATLDVLRGLDPARPRPAEPIVFPGNGATVALYRFVVESPDPLAMCGWAGTPAGLPLIAMMPSGVSAAEATLSGPQGPIETCVLHPGNVSDPTARAILAADNAVLVIPRVELADGGYSVTVGSDGGNAAWSFNVDRNAPLTGEAPAPAPPAPEPEPQKIEKAVLTGEPVSFVPQAPYRLVDTRIGQGANRLIGGQITRIKVAGPDVAAVSANFVAVGASGPGYLTAYSCTDERPTVSMLGYQPGQAIANQSVVPLQDGDLCLFAKADVDVVIDVNGTYAGDDGAGFHPIQPERVYHTESLGQPLAAGEERAVEIAGHGAPFGADAVALNVTAVWPDAAGYVQVYPCGAPSAADISTINYLSGDVRPNSVIVPLDSAGRVCLRSKATTDVIVDITGYFADGGLTFQPVVPVRMFDSRALQSELNPITGGAHVAADQVLRIPIAGVRGMPSDAQAVSVNLTATDPQGGTFLTAYPCGALPWASNLNIGPSQLSVANGAVVQLSPEGELCIYAKHAVHVIVDVNGVWL